MPLYEYECTSCGHSDTLLERVTAAKRKKCPSCGKPRAFERLLSAPSFHLKGTGWYVTDFRDQGKSGANGVKPSESEKREAGGSDAKEKKRAEKAGNETAAAKAKPEKQKAAAAKD